MTTTGHRSSVKALVVAICLGILCASRAADAGRFVIVQGDQIDHVRTFPGDGLHLEAKGLFGGPVSEQVFPTLGFHYQRWGLLGLDLWRWGGEFVAYDGPTYVALDDDEIDALGGADVPLRYHVPPGLLIVAALIELAIVTRRRRKLGAMLALGSAWLLVAVVLYVKGLDVELIVPALVGAHHLLGSWLALRAERDLARFEPEPTSAPAPEPIQPPPSALPPSPPTFETDPFRAPPRPPPLVVTRPPEPRSEVPVAHDDKADPPKMLR